MFLIEEKENILQDIITVEECYTEEDIIEEGVFDVVTKLYNIIKSKFAKLFELTKAYYNANKEILDNQENYKGVTIEKCIDKAFIMKCAKAYVSEVNNLVFLAEHLEAINVNLDQYKAKINAAIKLADQNSIFFRKVKLNINAKFTQSELKNTMLNPHNTCNWKEIENACARANKIMKDVYKMVTSSLSASSTYSIMTPKIDSKIKATVDKLNMKDNPAIGYMNTLCRLNQTNTDLLWDMEKSYSKSAMEFAKRVVSANK